MLKYCLSLCLIAALSVCAKAQETLPPEDEVCVSAKIIWLGSSTDIQNIQSQAIPESFRGRFEKKYCNYLDPRDLIVWHYKYGSEETMEAALMYLQDGVITKRNGLVPRKLEVELTPKELTEDYLMLAYYYRLAAEGFPSSGFVENAEDYHEKAKVQSDKLSHEAFKRVMTLRYISLEELSRNSDRAQRKINEARDKESPEHLGNE